MGNFTETSTFDAAIHEISTTDAVLGGDGSPINLSLGSLANRTKYLFDTVSALALSAAMLNSPAFTGSPIAPTVTAGDSSTKLATTAFVSNASRGLTSVDVSGSANITLNASQYGCAIIVLFGVLTGNINVMFPNSGEWTVINNATGAFTIKLKTAGGTGTFISQGKQLPIVCDGTNASPSFTDLAAVNLALANIPSSSFSPKQSDAGATFILGVTAAADITVTLDPAKVSDGWYASFIVPASSTHKIIFAAAGTFLDTVVNRDAIAGTSVTIYYNGTNFFSISGTYACLMVFLGWTNGSVSSSAHGLGVVVRPRITVMATCTTTEGGYAVGDVINVTGSVSAKINNTTGSIAVPSGGITCYRADTAASFTLTASKWTLTLLADSR